MINFVKMPSPSVDAKKKTVPTEGRSTRESIGKGSKRLRDAEEGISASIKVVISDSVGNRSVHVVSYNSTSLLPTNYSLCTASQPESTAVGSSADHGGQGRRPPGDLQMVLDAIYGVKKSLTERITSREDNLRGRVSDLGIKRWLVSVQSSMERWGNGKNECVHWRMLGFRPEVQVLTSKGSP